MMTDTTPPPVDDFELEPRRVRLKNLIGQLELSWGETAALLRWLAAELEQRDRSCAPDRVRRMHSDGSEAA